MEALIDEIYEAALTPDRWAGVLAAMARLFQTKGGLLFTTTAESTRWIASPSVADDMAVFVAEGWPAHNVRAPALIARRHAGFLTDLDFHSVEEMDAMPMYTEFCRPRGVYPSAGTHVVGALDDNLILSLEGFGDHDSAESAKPRLDALRPHLARAAMVASRLRLATARSAVAALESIGVPAGVVSGAGSLRAANPLFERELGAGVFSGVADMRLTDERADRTLRAALAKTRGGSCGASIALRGETAGAARVLHVLPIQGEAHDLFSSGGALLVLTSRRRSAGPAAGVLEQLYDLSPAESRVARAVAEGRSLDQIAGGTGTSIHTVRSQLKAVLAKTDCDRQSALALLLTGLSLP
jgi:DNA-binding CsgD family transcriptional regulator